jgi:hypothetical protein
VDPVQALAERVPVEVEVKCLAGRVVWLREAGREWLGPAEEALARLRGAEPAAGFWSAFPVRLPG